MSISLSPSRSCLFTLQKNSCHLNTRIFFHFASLEVLRLGVCFHGSLPFTFPFDQFFKTTFLCKSFELQDILVV